MPPAAVRAQFDVVWFGQPKARLSPSLFARLNQRGADGRGHYLVMPTTRHQDEITQAGNRLAFYYKALNTDDAKQPTWPRLSAKAVADGIAAQHRDQGFRTKWIFVNEISAMRWPAKREYRKWVIDIAARLHTHHGLRPAFFSPFATLRPDRPAGPDWKALSEHGWIAIEGYLSGPRILERVHQGDALEWCHDRYREMKDSYRQYGVPERKLFLTEHFGHTQQGVRRTWGRCGIPVDDWVGAISARSAAARQAKFGGYVSFAWMYNQMRAPDPDLLRCCDVYRAARSR